jgi:hypothetical protein
MQATSLRAADDSLLSSSAKDNSSFFMNTEFCIIIGTTETKQNFILKYLLK